PSERTALRHGSSLHTTSPGGGHVRGSTLLRTHPVFSHLFTYAGAALADPCRRRETKGPRQAPRLYHGAVSAPGRPPSVVRPTGRLPPRRPPGRWCGGG